MHLRRSIAAVAAVAAISLTNTALSQSPQSADTDEIRRLVERGRSDKAWPLCAEVDREAAPQLDLWCGIAAVDVGRIAEGLLTIERYVLRFPDDVRARLELARAYYFAGDDIAARREFEAVRATDPPADVRAGIDRFLDALLAREAQYRTRIRGYVEAGGGYDSNVNAGVAQADIALPVFGAVTVANFGVKRGDAFGWLAGNVQINHPIAPGVAVYAGAYANGTLNASEHEFDIAQGVVTLGASKQSGQHSVFGTYAHGELAVGGDRYRYSDGVSVEYRYAASELVTTSLTPQYARIAYNDVNRVRGSDFYALALSVRSLWLTSWQPVVNITGVGGREENREGRPDLGRDVYGGAADVTLSPAPQWALNAAFSIQRSLYAGNLPLLGFARKDDYYTASFGALYFFTRQLSARVEVQYFHNDSNLALYEFKRHIVAGKVRYDFR